MFSEGQAFSHFKIKRLLGKGGMGAVYLAEDEKLGREVALKILSSEFFSDTEKLKRFHREARTAAQVSSPYVMSIYDIGSAPMEEEGDEVHYIVMEYVRGESLSSWLTERKPETATILRMGEKIASGLASAHKLNIVHRDIKSDNIIVDENDDPRILDFGLAKPVEPLGLKSDEPKTDTISEELTQAGKIIGTVSYMSPEQAKGETVDTRSDIFSFGILLYRMATGVFPFTGETQVSTLAKILEGRHEPLRSKDASISPEMERIVDKCLQKNPDDRYQNTQDLVLDIRSLRRQFDSGITETVTSVTNRAVPSGGGKLRKTILAGAAILVVAALAVILSLADFGGSQTNQTVQAAGNTLAIVGFQNKTGDPGLDWLKSGLPEVLLTDLAQSEAITVVSPRRMDDHLAAMSDGDGEGNHSYDDYLQCAIDIGAVNVLSGSYFKLGDKIRIDARMEEVATGKIVLAEKVMGDDAFVLVDSLSDKIASSLNILESMSGATNASDFASRSPEAYKHYLQGLELFDRELYDSARAQFHQAIALDSTFALPYMRIGMAHVFEGRVQEGRPWFLKASEHEGKLPVKDRALLDVYRDTWVHQQFDAAMTKLQSFVRSYPEDPEGRVIYGIFLYQIKRDSTASLAQFDTALALQPGFQLAMAQYINLYVAYDNDAKALEYANRLREAHPESPAGYIAIGATNRRMGNMQEAVAAYEVLADRFPENRVAYDALADIYIGQRDFDKAREYLEKLRKKHGHDPVVMGSYYNSLSNIASWEGKLTQALDLQRERLRVYQGVIDSTRVLTTYRMMGHLYTTLGMSDSALAAYHEGSKYAIPFEKIQFPLIAVSLETADADELRGPFKEAAKAFRAATPPDVWPVVEYIEALFEAYAINDTAGIIAAMRQLKESPFSRGFDHQMAEMLVASGHHQEAWDLFEDYYSRPNPEWSAISYIPAQYYRGYAAEQLGMKQEAIGFYEEVLRYWGQSDMALKEVKLAREGLARLQT